MTMGAATAFLLATDPGCFRVCTSPACAADGAGDTLAALRALTTATPVETTGCTSACGKGPIVLTDGQTHRRVSGISKIQDLLEGYNEMPAGERLEGYETYLKAEEKFAANDKMEALTLYRNAVDAVLPLIDTIKYPAWLVQSYRHQAQIFLDQRDNDSALQAALAACQIQADCALNYKVLAQVHAQMENVDSELEALRNLVATPGEDDVNANERREIGFRIAKLERLLSA